MTKKISLNNAQKTLSLLLLLVLIFICGCSNESNNISISDTSENNEFKSTSINLTAVGDVMAHSPQLKAQYNSQNNTYSFDNNFKYIKKYIENSDLSIANLETTLAGESVGYSSYPTFNTPDAIATALKNTGFDIISTINNHTFDKGTQAFDRTLSVLKELELETVGTKSDINNDDYIIKDINGIKLGITSYSYGDIINEDKYLNGIKLSDECKDRANIFSSSNVNDAFNTINNTISKLNDTDMQVLIIHWGNEYQRVPSEFQSQLAQKLSDAGVDIIIGSHPHVVQPVEMIKSSDGNTETLIVYSLGNLISNQRRETLGNSYTEDGLIVSIDINKDSYDGNAYVSSVKCIPTWVNKYSDNNKFVYEVVPIEDKVTLNTMENLSQSKVKQSYSNTSSLIDTSEIIQVVNSPFE